MMKRSSRPCRVAFGALVIGAALLLAGCLPASQDDASTPSPKAFFTYRGRNIYWRKNYETYEDYKDDPDNLAPGEAQKLRSLMETAPIARHLPNSAEVSRIFVSEIGFPGYAVGVGGITKLPDGSTLTLWMVEVPHAEEQRVFTFHVRNGAYELIDDFLTPLGPLVGAVFPEGARLRYTFLNSPRTVVRTPSLRVPEAEPSPLPSVSAPPAK